jgi:hypothetical protein
MSQADELLNGISTFTANPEIEPHIVVGEDRFITVPDELKRIAVQYDHRVETVTFDCPRHWDGADMSKMKIYINYVRSDGLLGMYLATNVVAEGYNTNVMHFDWTLTRNVTGIDGVISFLVCVKKVDDDGNEEIHWNSELCNDMYVSSGLEGEETVRNEYPDIFTQMLQRMDEIEGWQNDSQTMYKNTLEQINKTQILINEINKIATPDAMQGYVSDWLSNNPLDILKVYESLCSFTTNAEIDAIIAGTFVDDVVHEAWEELLDFATDSDIDEIIAGTFVDSTPGGSTDGTDDTVTDKELDDIVNGSFD